MRNLKKILALVLALVMSLSLMITANAFTDDEKISGSYDEAVEVLSGLKVFEGYEDGSFQPQGKITREEVAAIIYRIASGDVTNSQKNLYIEGAKFDDVAPSRWSAGYIGYCANGGLVNGYGDGKFGPADEVTGYQALAMILRAVGYDQKGEFTGSGWQKNVATTAQQLGILKNVSSSVKLSEPATRELVAELLFQTVAYVDQVDWTPAFSYQPINVNGRTVTIGEEQFGLHTVTPDAIDEWGRPGYFWHAGSTWVATIEEPYLAQYKTAVTECQVAADIHQSTREVTYTTYTNGTAHNVGTQVINSIDTVGTIGAQGRITEVYSDRIVMVDTLLAKVTNVTAARYDAAGHMIAGAKLYLEAYDVAATTDVTLDNGAASWTYAVGDMVLINAVQNGNTVCTAAACQYVDVLGVASSIVGAQTNIWVNARQHTVNGTTYPDSNRYLLNDAGNDSTKNYTWYFDENGNLLGSSEIPATYSYAVLKNIIWVPGAPGYATATLIDAATGAESVVTVDSLDGWATNNWASASNDAVPTYQVAGTYNFSGTTAYVSNESLLNGAYAGIALYRVTTKANDHVALDGYNGVVNYRHSTTITTYATTFTGVNGQPVYVDDNTVFTAKTASGYVQYVGKNNVPSYVDGTVRAFYVDVDNDNIADYVYIKEGTPTYAGEAFVMATAPTYKTMYEGSTAYDVLVSALVGGVPTTDGVYALHDSSDYVRVLAGRVGVPHYVGYGADGAVTSIDAFDEVATETYSYSYTYYVKLRAPYLSGTTLLGFNAAGDAVAHSISTSYLGDAVYGDYTALESVTDWTAVDVYVVYTSYNSGVDGYASSVYVVNKAATDPGDTPVVPGAATVKYVLEVWQGGTLIDVKNSSWSGPAGTYDHQDFATIKVSHFPTFTLSSSEYSVLSDNTSVTVGADETVVLTYKVIVG